MNYADDVRAFVVANFLYGDAAPLRDNTSFLSGGILDSTGILELVTFLESTYDIEIETQELLPANLDSINNVAQFLSRKLDQGKPGAPCLYAPNPLPGELAP
ncbi:MAG: acyl carrier protein [bacterium]